MEQGRNQVSISTHSIVDAIRLNSFDEAVCTEQIARILYPDGARCPFCCSPYPSIRAQRFYRNLRCLCPSCGKKFNSIGSARAFSQRFSPAEVMAVVVMDRLGFRRNQIAARTGREYHAIGRLLSALEESHARNKGQNQAD